jgi:glycosyltransferase involved in cell wall biosynthesis
MAPAVSIVVPTYNRAATLERAVRSALEQTHADLEVVVSDNASTDGTAALLQRLAAADPRVRVVRHAANHGMVANIAGAASLARGDHVMLLADDDWLAPRCVEAALAALRARPGAAGAVAAVTYVRDGATVAAGGLRAIEARAGARRVWDYFARVGADRGNTWIYALMPRAVVAALSPPRNVLGFDWLRVAEVAFLGPIALVDEPLVFRELGGTSESTRRNVSESRLPALHARLPHLVIAAEVLADIGWRSPVYAPLGRRRRLALAAACAASVPARNLPHVVFHLAPRALQERGGRRNGA